MQQRYYDPQVGRFLSTDPAESEFNQYNYASNNPYRFFDPDGRVAADPNKPATPQPDASQTECDIECKRQRQAERNAKGNGVYGDFSGWASSTAAANGIPDSLYTGLIGATDVLSWGAAEEVRQGMDSGPAVDTDSTSYAVGSYGSIVFGLGAVAPRGAKASLPVVARFLQNNAGGKGALGTAIRWLGNGRGLRVGVGRLGGGKSLRVAGDYLGKIPKPLREKLGITFDGKTFKWDLHEVAAP